MSIKLILVPLSGQRDSNDRDEQDVAALEAAFQLGEKFEARVRVFLIEPAKTDTGNQLARWLPKYGLDEVFKMVDAENEQRRALAQQAFTSTMERLNAPLASDRVSHGFAVEFMERIGDVQHSLECHGKLADLIVLAQQLSSGPTSGYKMLETALLDTGRPVLITPECCKGKLGEHIAIGWNGSQEATRAIAMTLPLLNQAKRVTLVVIQENGRIEPDAQLLSNYFRFHNIEASTITVDDSAVDPGISILEEVDRMGADLLVMGAYTRKRARQLLFGGTTEFILRQTTVPVIMVH